MITSIVENYQKSNRLPIKNMFFNKKKEVKNTPKTLTDIRAPLIEWFKLLSQISLSVMPFEAILKFY